MASKKPSPKTRRKPVSRKKKGAKRRTSKKKDAGSAGAEPSRAAATDESHAEATAPPAMTDTGDAPMTDRRLADLHVWEFRWVRDIFMILAAVAMLWLVYSLRAIALPVVAGLSLAYLFNPLVSRVNKRWGVPRVAVGLVAVFLVAALVVGMMAGAAPVVAGQVSSVLKNRNEYITRIEKWRTRIEQELHLAPESSTAAEKDGSTPDASEKTDIDAARPGDETPDDDSASGRLGRDILAVRPDARSLYDFATRALGISYGIVSDVIDLTLYLVLFSLLTGLSFFYFSWRFPHILVWFGQFVPTHRRPQAAYIARRMHRAVFGFVRGRLAQSAIMMILMTAGLAIVNIWVPVPGYPLIGIAAGFLNLIPYAAVLAWLTAIGMAWVAQDPDQFNTWGVLLGPTVVYLIVQFLDGWAIEPLVQGRAVELSGLTIVLAVLIGGSLFGLLGLVIAIPATACLKILWEEVGLPRLKAYLEQLP